MTKIRPFWYLPSRSIQFWVAVRANRSAIFTLWEEEDKFRYFWVFVQIWPPAKFGYFLIPTDQKGDIGRPSAALAAAPAARRALTRAGHKAHAARSSLRGRVWGR